MAVVMIGVDPHKASHTAVVVGADEAVLGQLRVRASAVQATRLLEWAAAWAVEGAGGLGHLLALERYGLSRNVCTDSSIRRISRLTWSLLVTRGGMRRRGF